MKRGVSTTTIAGTLTPVDNPQIADHLDAFASMLELVEANPYTARAYRRAAETIREAAFPVERIRAGLDGRFGAVHELDSGGRIYFACTGS